MTGSAVPAGPRAPSLSCVSAWSVIEAAATGAAALGRGVANPAKVPVRPLREGGLGLTLEVGLAFR